VTALIVAGAYGLTWYMQPIWACATAGAVIYVVAIADRYLKLKLLSRLAQQVVIVMMPPLALIFLVLGTIFLGIATPTEGGAMGAVGALVMAAVKGRLSMDVVRQALTSTTRLSSFVLFILIGARTFSLTFYGVNGHLWVEHLLLSVPGGELGFLIVVNILVFVLAFFLDFFELAFILIPLLAPVADKLGIDLIWFGVLLGVNMQTSFMHPPFGFALFYLRSVAARVPYLDKVTGKKIEPITTGQIYWGAVPFVVIQVLMIGLTIAFPQMVMRYKGDAVQQDIKNIHIQVPGLGGDGTGFNPFAAPGSSGNTQAPGLGGTPPGLGGTPPGLGGGASTPKPATPPPATDLSQPPKFN
jgi:tripartite ATP-independent transporter DctM subunit